jgi:hypothetical protein
MITHTLTCDLCHNRKLTAFTTKELYNNAALLGWKYYDGIIMVCPMCIKGFERRVANKPKDVNHDTD